MKTKCSKSSSRPTAGQNRVQIARNTGLSESEIETATADLLQIKVV
jgi:hypothetical protein